MAVVFRELAAIGVAASEDVGCFVKQRGQPAEEDALTVFRVDHVWHARWAYIELTDIFPGAKSTDDEQLQRMCGDPYRERHRARVHISEAAERRKRIP